MVTSNASSTPVQSMKIFLPSRKQKLHAAGVHVEMTSSCIVLHVHVLLKSCCGLCRSIYDFGFHLPRTPALNFPKKTNNPNPSPIGNKFGLFLFGPSGENRTHGLLNPIQARYQNCATPGYFVVSLSLTAHLVYPRKAVLSSAFFKFFQVLFHCFRRSRRWTFRASVVRQIPPWRGPLQRHFRLRRPAAPGCRRRRWPRW